MDFPDKLVDFSLFEPAQDSFSLDNVIFKILVIFGILFIEPLNSFKDRVGELYISINPLLALFDVATDFVELKNWFNQFEHVHDHELYSL